MTQRWISFALPALAAAGMWLAVPTPSRAQGNAYKAPRAADGKADLQGIWQILSTGPASGLEPHTPALHITAGLGVIVDPADGRIPYRPEARAKQLENFKNRFTADPETRCYLPGTPRVMALPFPFQILQTPKLVVLLSEYMHTTRNIFLGGEHLDGLDTWMGDSRGHWEGDTLVVDVRNFNDQTWFDKIGNHHSDALHVVERYTRTGPDTLTYEATMEDAKTFTRPWTIRLLLQRRTEPNIRILEYDCSAYIEDEGGLK